MDARLNERLTKWHAQIEILSSAEKDCLVLEANEKPFFSKLFLEVEGKSVAEKEARVYSDARWVSLSAGLVEARVEYNKEKRILELKQAAFQAEYLQAKVEGETIQKYPRGVT